MKPIMDSSATTSSLTGLTQVVDKSNFPATNKNNSTSPSRRRSPSFSSLSSLSSRSSSIGSLHFPQDSPLISPAATPLRFSGVPFSWEHLPGIPKKNIPKKKESILKQQQLQLPLPPTSAPPISKKSHFSQEPRKKHYSAERDPFVAALVHCSKDDGRDDDEDDDQDHERSSRNFLRVSRSISDRFGFVNLYTSCKKTCAVSESIVYLPARSSRTSYDLIRRRSR